MAGVLVLFLVLTACRPDAEPEKGPGYEPTIPMPEPSPVGGSPEPRAAQVTPAPIEQAQTEKPIPATLTLGSPPVNPTRLPEPHLVHVLEWELVSANSNSLCAGCEGDQIVVPAPPGLGIAVIRIYSSGAAGDEAAVDTDLAFSTSVNCRAKSSGGFCGLIFGQVRGGKLSLRARHVTGAPHNLTYLITFQRWEDYPP
jgi:hypothetical protein